MTIKDIAKESGYAIGTVSRVLNNHENVSKKAYTAIMEVVKKHNFQINVAAKNLKTQVSKSVIILVKGNSNRLFSKMVEDIQVNITKAGYAVVVDYFDENENEVLRAISAVREQKPMGLIFLGGIRENFKNYFEHISIPCVMLTNNASEWGFDNLSSVSIDDRRGSKEGVDFLFSKNHKQIGIVGGDLQLSEISQIRMNGILQSFEEHNINFDFDRQFQKARFSLGSGYSNGKKLMEKFPQVTAIFAMSDVMAMGIAKAVFDSGKKVPEDISVIGFDGLDITAYYNPSLTTIEQSIEDIAMNSTQILIERMDDENMPSKHITSAHKVLARNSVREYKG